MQFGSKDRNEQREVNGCLMILDLRERRIAMLAILAGLRPDEIVGLTVGQAKEPRSKFVSAFIEVSWIAVSRPSRNATLRLVVGLGSCFGSGWSSYQTPSPTHGCSRLKMGRRFRKTPAGGDTLRRV